MSRNNFLRLINNPRSRRALLFADGTSGGWIDVVHSDNYPTLADLLTEAPDLPFIGSGVITVENLNSIPFSLPLCFDDFGIVNWIRSDYPNRYDDMIEQWSACRIQIVDEQQVIFEREWREFPKPKGCYLYFLTSTVSGTERVVYVGKQCARDSGLRKRFMHHVKSNPMEKRDGYIGDCINADDSSKQNAYLGIRVKSSELRRRGIEKVYWIDVQPQLTFALGTHDNKAVQEGVKEIEQNLIVSKFSFIRSRTDCEFANDPINEK